MADRMTSQILGFNTGHLTDDLFKDILSGIKNEASLVSWSGFDIHSAHGYLANIVTDGPSHKRITGIHGFEIMYTLPDNQDIHVKKVVLKSKPRDREVISYLENAVPDSEEFMLPIWKRFLHKYKLDATDQRELLFVQLVEPVAASIMPDIYWSMIHEELDIFVFAMDYFDPDSYSHVNTFSDFTIWMEDDILQILQGIASLHARYYGNISDIPANLLRYMPTMNKTYVMELAPLAHKLVELNFQHYKDVLWTEEGHHIMSKISRSIDAIADIIDNCPKTLIHNDFSLRNLCMRKEPGYGKHRVCVYDWEMISIGVPQRDLAEFLKHHMKPTSDLPSWDFYLEYYFKYLLKELDKYGIHQSEDPNLELEEFKKVFDAYMMVMFLVINGGLASVFIRKLKWPLEKSSYSTILNYIQRVSNKCPFLR